MRDEFDQAEAALEQQYADGLLSLAEFNAEMRANARYYREQAEAAAQDAYDAEMEQW